MNFPRIALAAVVAWITSIGVGYLVNEVLLADLYAQHRSALRPEAEIMGLLPIGFGAMLLGFFVFAYAYAKGYEGGSGLQEGLRFGVIVGLLIVCFSIVWQYVAFPVSSSFLVASVVDSIVESALYGVIVGVIYRPSRSRAGF